MSTLINADLQKLVNIMNELREKCPWDKKQTIHTLRQQTIEETYELTDAITGEDWQGIKEELGDVLLHIVFYAKIATEQNKFTLDDVITSVCEKLIVRHPHIYGSEENAGKLIEVKDAEEVKRNWEQIKLKEGKRTSILGGVPKGLPSMVKAMRLQEKAKQVGFEWNTKEEVWDKIIEEEQELLKAIESGIKKDIEEETGDLFFSLINYARFLQVDAENALELTNIKFIKRFTAMEKIAAENGQNLADMTLVEMDTMWNKIKLQNKAD